MYRANDVDSGRLAMPGQDNVPLCGVLSRINQNVLEFRGDRLSIEPGRQPHQNSPRRSH